MVEKKSNEGSIILHFPPNIMAIKVRWMRKTRHEAYERNNKQATYKLLVGKFGGKRQLGR
jgi:hypothetical protein